MGNHLQAHLYGEFRNDIPAKPHHSKEMICITNKSHPDQLALPIFKGCDTLWKGFKDTVSRMPNENFLGTRNLALKEEMPYEWKTFKEAHDIALNFA
jgi:hypothetical protein